MFVKLGSKNVNKFTVSAYHLKKLCDFWTLLTIVLHYLCLE